MTRTGRSATVERRWTLWLRTAVRLVLAAVFVVAGANTVLDLGSSVRSVGAYRLLPGPAATVVGVVLPFAEIVLGLVLAAGLVTRIAAACSAALLIVFTLATLSVAARGIAIDCGCFGGGGPVAPGQTGYLLEVVRDLVLIAAAGWLLVRPATRLSLTGGLHRPDDPTEPTPEEAAGLLAGTARDEPADPRHGPAGDVLAPAGPRTRQRPDRTARSGT